MSLSDEDGEIIEKLQHYAMHNYRQLLDKVAMGCPYRFEDDATNFTISHVWAAHEVILPDKGISLLEEFAQKYVDDPVMAEKICRATPILCGEFVVMELWKDGTFLIRFIENDATYKAKAGPIVMDYISVGVESTCAINPWYSDGTYRMIALIPRLCHSNVRKFRYRRFSSFSSDK